MTQSRKRRSFSLLAVAAALVLAPPALFADKGDSSFHLRIDGEEGGRVDLDLSLGWLASFVDWADLECDTHTDATTRRMARNLDRQGEGGVYEFEDDDGDRVVARRQNGRLTIRSRDDDGETANIEMPWPLAECLFLGRTPKGGLRKALGDFRVRVEGKDGDRVSIDVD